MPDDWRLIVFFAFLILVAASSVGLAHSWYDPACCDNRDCRPIPGEAVTITPQGYRVQHDGIDQTVPFHDALPSRDAGWHICITIDGARIRRIGKGTCLYAPLGG